MFFNFSIMEVILTIISFEIHRGTFFTMAQLTGTVVAVCNAALGDETNAIYWVAFSAFASALANIDRMEEESLFRQRLVEDLNALKSQIDFLRTGARELNQTVLAMLERESA